MKLVTPEAWYRAFWLVMAVGGALAVYFAVRYGVLWALLEFKRRGG